MTRVSVIVPAWNEAKELPACLRSVGAQQPDVEVIVADGGSTDRTREIAAEHGAGVIVSPIRQRAAQLNLAVQQASGDVLLFLHADTALPSGWLAELRTLLDADAGIIGGAFCRRFDHPSWWLRGTSALADWRGRIWGCFLGDQAMFIRSSVFRSLGGFRPLDQCEDLDLSLRMSRIGRTRMIGRPVLSSGRRFLSRGPFRQTWADFAAAWRFIRHRPSAEAVTETKPAMRWKWVLYLGVAIALVAGAQFFPVQDLLRQALNWVGQLGPWGVILFIGLYVVATVLFVPGSVLTLGAGAVFGVAWGSIYVSIASTLGATCAFLVGRYLAREAIAQKIGGNARFAAIDRAVAREGWKIVGLTRLSPVFPFTLLNYAFGLTQVSLRDYVLASWIGMMPGTVMYVYLGSLAKAAAGERTRTPGEWALYSVGLPATVIVTVFVTRIAKQALARRITP